MSLMTFNKYTLPFGNHEKIILIPKTHGYIHKLKCHKRSNKDLKCNCRNYETSANQKLKNNKIRSKIKMYEKAVLNFEMANEISFITLTFKKNINDIQQANKYFVRWIQKLQYRYGSDFKYLRVAEPQKRGAIHYHIIIDKYMELAVPYWLQIAREGVKKQGQKNLLVEYGTEKNVIGYLSKYIGKTFVDKDWLGVNLKAYQFSRNCQTPIKTVEEVILDEKELNQIKINAILDPSQEFYKSSSSNQVPYVKIVRLTNGITDNDYRESHAFVKKSNKEYELFTQNSLKFMNNFNA